MNNKLIFLDIDGVLNNNSMNYDSGIMGWDTLHNKYRKLFIDKTNVDNLNYLLAYTKADIVVSSTWRLGETIESMQKTLDSIGVVGKVVGLTGRSPSNIRGVEILEYIKESVDECYHMYDDYVILDDDSDMLLWQKSNFVLIDHAHGLTKGDVWKAINILNRGTE